MGVLQGQFVGLFDIVTDANFRRQGFGKQLVLSILAWGKTQWRAHGLSSSHAEQRAGAAPVLWIRIQRDLHILVSNQSKIGNINMPKRTDIHSVFVIGSGPIVIGQAAEFDYSGTQAVKALRAEGYRVVLVNSNPATIMTDPELADATYIEPLTPEALEAIIAQERPDAMLPTVGGQTGLNMAQALARARRAGTVRRQVDRRVAALDPDRRRPPTLSPDDAGAGHPRAARRRGVLGRGSAQAGRRDRLSLARARVVCAGRHGRELGQRAGPACRGG